METFRCLVPICSNPLRSQLYFLQTFINYFTKTKIGDLDFTVVKYYVLRLEIEMDYFLFALVFLLFFFLLDYGPIFYR